MYIYVHSCDLPTLTNDSDEGSNDDWKEDEGADDGMYQEVCLKLSFICNRIAKGQRSLYGIHVNTCVSITSACLIKITREGKFPGLSSVVVLWLVV